MNYTHIIPQRLILIEEYRFSEMSLSYIARQLKRSKSTIKYELDCDSLYNAHQAQLDYDAKRENCGCKIVVGLKDINHILDHLRKEWSSEIIVGRYKK